MKSTTIVEEPEHVVTLSRLRRTKDIMHKTRFLLPLAALALLLPTAAGCDSKDKSEPTERALEDVEASRYVITSDATLSPEDIETISQTLTGKATDVRSAEISATREKHDDVEQWIVSIDLAAAALPGDEVFQALVAEIPALADATFAIEDVDDISPPGGAEMDVVVKTAVKDGASDEDIEDQVVDELRAQGVDGDIYVDVSDEAGGKRVEVQVEDHEVVESDAE